MPATRNFLAFDFGAESGRAIVGRFGGGRLKIEELHRFPNRPVRRSGTLYWNASGLRREMLHGLRAFAERRIGRLEGVSVDTWGVDFGIVGRNGRLLDNPVHYRDSRTSGMVEKAFEFMPREEIHRLTGNQILPINSLYQLLAMRLGGSPQLRSGNRLLMMSDLFTYYLSGVQANEYTIASTTQLCDPRRRQWAPAILDAMDFPRGLFHEIIQPGEVLGPLQPKTVKAGGLRREDRTQVVAGLGHDTAAAIAAAPARDEDWCYISSGTWSVMGVELPRPRITKKTLARNLTNEGGLDGTTLLLNNITGLWIVQQVAAQFAREGRPRSYGRLAQMAGQARAPRALIHVDHPEFMPPGDMASRIVRWCERTGQPTPDSDGAVIRCALESLAMRYRWTLESLEDVAGRRFRAIHVVGGGSRNALLNQMTADATGMPVIAGPAEATAIGNVLTAALALGAIGSPEEIREVAARSFLTRTFEPRDRGPWDERYGAYLRLLGEDR